MVISNYGVMYVTHTAQRVVLHKLYSCLVSWKHPPAQKQKKQKIHFLRQMLYIYLFVFLITDKRFN